MENFASEGGMLPEQLWDADDLPDGKMKRGDPTGSAMPLCWSHAEYIYISLGCGLRRSEVSALTMNHIQQRDGRWVILDLVSKHKRVRTVPMPT
jgi:integrase